MSDSVTGILRRFMNYKRPVHVPFVENMIDASAIVPESSQVWWYTIVQAGVRIGERVSIGALTEIGRGSTIGDDTRIGAHVFLPPNSVIGAKVFIGPGARFADDMHPRVHLEGDEPYTPQPPIVEDEAVIGMNCTILPGVRIGRGARVAAGTTVTKDIPEDAMMRGQPGRFRTMPREWERKKEAV